MNIERSRTSSRPVRQSWGYSFKNTAIYDPSSCPISFIDYEEDSNILYSDLTGANVRGGIALRQEDNPGVTQLYHFADLLTDFNITNHGTWDPRLLSNLTRYFPYG